MKTYKDLHTLTDVAKAMDAGKVVERKWKRGNPTNSYYWEKPEYTKNIDMFDWNYRTVKETELPEQGDEILVWHTKEVKKSKRKFVAFWKDKVVTEYDSGTDVCVWNHWKPIDKKPKPRKGWVYPSELREEAGGIIKIFVREVLEDE